MEATNYRQAALTFKVQCILSFWSTACNGAGTS